VRPQYYQVGPNGEQLWLDDYWEPTGRFRLGKKVVYYDQNGNPVERGSTVIPSGPEGNLPGHPSKHVPNAQAYLPYMTGQYTSALLNHMDPDTIGKWNTYVDAMRGQYGPNWNPQFVTPGSPLGPLDAQRIDIPVSGLRGAGMSKEQMALYGLDDEMVRAVAMATGGGVLSPYGTVNLQMEKKPKKGVNWLPGMTKGTAPGMGSLIIPESGTMTSEQRQAQQAVVDQVVQQKKANELQREAIDTQKRATDATTKSATAQQKIAQQNQTIIANNNSNASKQIPPDADSPTSAPLYRATRGEKFYNRANTAASIFTIAQMLGIPDALIDMLPENAQGMGEGLNYGLSALSMAQMLLGPQIAGWIGGAGGAAGAAGAGAAAGGIAAALAPAAVAALGFGIDQAIYDSKVRDASNTAEHMKSIYGDISMAEWINEGHKDAKMIVEAIKGQQKVDKDAVKEITDPSAKIKTSAGVTMEQEIQAAMGRYSGIDPTKTKALRANDEYVIRAKYLRQQFDASMPNKALFPNEYKKWEENKKNAMYALYNQFFPGDMLTDGGTLLTKMLDVTPDQLLSGKTMTADSAINELKYNGLTSLDWAHRPLPFDTVAEKAAMEDAAKRGKLDEYVSTLKAKYSSPESVYAWSNAMYKSQYGTELSWNDFMRNVWNNPMARANLLNSGTYTQIYPRGMGKDGNPAPTTFDPNNPIGYAPWTTGYNYFDPSFVRGMMTTSMPEYMMKHPAYNATGIPENGRVGYNRSFMDKYFNKDGTVNDQAYIGWWKQSHAAPSANAPSGAQKTYDDAASSALRGFKDSLNAVFKVDTGKGADQIQQEAWKALMSAVKNPVTNITINIDQNGKATVTSDGQKPSLNVNPSSRFGGGNPPLSSLD
jgi:hypothetical protein